MGLRINNNISAVRALRNLKINDRNQSKSLERLSTGLQINRASDDPAGLVISEQLRAQIISMKQAAENTQNASNLIGTADAALQQVSDLLNDVRDSVLFALNEGVSSPEQVGAEQASVDQALQAIDRISATTRYSDSELLNGTKGFTVTTQSDELNDLNVRRATFAPTMSAQGTITYTVDVTQSAVRGFVDIGSTATGTIIRVTGPLGTQEISVSSNTVAQLATAINQYAPFTGVWASAKGGAGATSQLAYTEEWGSTQSIRIDVLSGTMDGLASGNARTDIGQDAKASFNGVTYTGEGRFFHIVNNSIDFEFALDDSVDMMRQAGLKFAVQKSGLSFQTNERALQSDRMTIGIMNVATSTLGYEAINDQLTRKAGLDAAATKGGFLSSLKTGGTSDLNTNAQNALNILDHALNQVNGLRGFLGAIQTNNLESNMDTLAVSIENITSSESEIRDLDFAAETAEFTRTQIMFQAGTAVLASANLIPQTVLTLLQ